MRKLRLVRVADTKDGETRDRKRRRKRRLELLEDKRRQDAEKRAQHIASEVTVAVTPDIDNLPFHTASTVTRAKDRLSAKKPRVFRLVRLSNAAKPEAAKKDAKQDSLCARLQPLTREESRVLDRAVEEDTVVEGPGYKLTGEHFAKLVAPSSWLDDTVLDAYMKLINVRNESVFTSSSHVTAEPEPSSSAATAVAPPLTPAVVHGRNGTRTRTYAFGTFFFSLLCPTRARYSYEAVRCWTTGPAASYSKQSLEATRAKGKVRILDYKQVLVPVNLCRSHWVLAVVDFRNKEFMYMDSLRSRDGVRGVVPTLRRWLSDEVTDKYGAEVMQRLEIGTWKTVENPPDMPTQTDADSCGMFCLALAECRELGRCPDFAQENMPVLRSRAALALYRGALPES